MSLRLAVATEDFETTLRRAITRAAKAEVSAVRLNARREVLAEDISATGLRQLRQYVRENRMCIAGLSCPTRHSLAEQEFLEERVGVIRSAMDLARPLQCTTVMVHCGVIPDPDDCSEPTAPTGQHIHGSVSPFTFSESKRADSSKPLTNRDPFRDLCEVTSDLARYGDHVGCVLTLLLPNYDASRISRLLESVTTGPLQIVFDPAIAVFSGADVVSSFGALHDCVGWVRARDGIRNVDLSGMETAVGDGIVDWDQLLPTLIEADFPGWICVERTTGEHRASDVLKSVARVKSLLPQPTNG